MQSLKYGLIGCGRISINHLMAARKNNLEIAALCDLVPNRTKEMIETCQLNSSNIRCYTNYLEMLNKENLDVVAIATDSGSHGMIAKESIKHKINTIIEKPIALSIKEADEIIKLSKEYGVKVTVCHQNRFNKSIQKLHEAVQQERFGKIFYASANIRWHRNENYYKQAPWRGTWEKDGGALMNQCIHNIDLLKWMLGDQVKEVVAMTDNLSHPYIEAEDFGIALIKFENGAYGVVEGTTCIYPKNLEETLFLFGEKGTAKVGGTSVNVIELWDFEDKRDSLESIREIYKEEPENIYGYGHYLVYHDMMDAIFLNREPEITAKAGRDALALVLAIYESSRRKSIVLWPLSSGSTFDYK
ncbi:MAG: Gfo/Idh/MocA family protein [Velocimicrobium sp.]